MNSLEQGIESVNARTTGPSRILVVDDEDIIRVLLTEIRWTPLLRQHEG